MSQGNLLVVDDEPTVLEVFHRYLDELGYQIEVASCGEDALRIASEFPVHVALVDLRLPGMDGLSLIRELKRLQPGVQSVIVSGAGELEDAIEAIKEQVYYYLKKPPVLSELGQTIRLAMDRYQLEQQNRIYQEELRNQKNFIEEIIENVNLFVVGFDLNNRINLFNRLAETISGYSKAEVLGKEAATIFPNNPLPFIDSKHVVIRKSKRSTLMLPFEFPICTKDKRTIDFLWTESRVINESGEMTGWIGFGEDLTEKKILEGKLIQSEKLAATGRLAAAVAHEINNPLQGIKSNFNLITAHLQDDYDETFRVSLVSEGLNRIANIVHRLLDVHRPRSMEIEDIDMPSLIRRVYALLEPTCRKAKVEVDLKLSDCTYPVRGSYSDLYQVFLNLVLNSIEAMPGGGKIAIDLKQKNSQVKVLVSDTGLGIANNDLDYIFEPFFSTKKDSQGVGLGLSVVRGILESLDGNIEVVNTDQDGTCFQVSLPVSETFEECKA